MTLRPFFSYYGSKWRSVPKYPEPRFNTIIEPFAGSACYSLYYPNKRVLLADKNPVVVAVWEYLILASKREIYNLPEFGPDDTVHDFRLIPEQKYLIGFWLNSATSTPCQRPSAWVRSRIIKGTPNSQAACWGAAVKSRIISQLDYIRHWKVKEADYLELANPKGTWFIDPPYQTGGKHYPKSSKDIDFNELGRWSRQRNGQVIVCENEGADWLPFRHGFTAQGTPGKTRTMISKEVFWLKSPKM